MIVIGLNGPAGSGKDTAFGFVEEWATAHGLSTVRRGFADMLKWSLYRNFYPRCTMQEAVAWADRDKNNPDCEVVFDHGASILTARMMLQRYGTEAHRDVFGPDFWLDQLLPRNEVDRIRAIMRHADDTRYPQIVGITDLRFENEAERVKAIGGHVWRIDPCGRLPQNDTHISEQSIPHRYVDCVIQNQDTLDEYKKVVSSLCDRILAKEFCEQRL